MDTDGSDLDILVDTTEETSLFDIGVLREELTELLGVDVDVLTPWGAARQVENASAR